MELKTGKIMPRFCSHYRGLRAAGQLCSNFILLRTEGLDKAAEEGRDEAGSSIRRPEICDVELAFSMPVVGSF